MRAKFFKVLTLAGFCALLFGASARADATIGQAAPALVSKTLDGKDFDLAALKGKVVVVHYWATWCGACREEMPALESVWRQQHGKGLEVLAISADRPRSKADVDQVMHYFTFPAAMYGSLSKNEFGTPTALPITYIIDKSGNVANILTPDTAPLNQAGFGDTVKALLDVKNDAKPDEKKDDTKKEETKDSAKTDAKQ